MTERRWVRVCGCVGILFFGVIVFVIGADYRCFAADLPGSHVTDIQDTDRTTIATGTIEENHADSSESKRKRCFFKPETGPCKGLFKKYYYDAHGKACKSFIWGGCGGVVPFDNEEDCKNTCATAPVNAGAVSDEAKRHYDRGMAAVEMGNYEGAISEFEKAKSLVPTWANIYYHLGLTQDKAGKYGDAITNLKQYLRLAPNAVNAGEAKSVINKLEYKKEKADKETKLKNILKGEWIANHSPRRGFSEWPVQFFIEEESIYLYAPTIDYQQTSFTHYRKIPVKRDNDSIHFTLVWEQSLRGFEHTSKEEVKFNLTLADSRTLKGTITYTPKEGWSYPQHTKIVLFRKK